MRLAAFALAACLAMPAAFAGVNDRCQEPFGPVVPNGDTATPAEMKQARREVLQFISDSDVFQGCVLKVIEDPEEKMTDAQKKAALKRIDSNQHEKQAVADAFNAALKRFKARGLSLED